VNGLKQLAEFTWGKVAPRPDRYTLDADRADADAA
jgi:hypothetical protein